MSKDKIPTELNRHIRQFVHAGDLRTIEQTILAIHNLISRNKKFVLEFDAVEDLKFSFTPKYLRVNDNEVINTTKIELDFDPHHTQSVSIIGRAFPFSHQTEDEIGEQKKWIVFFLYDLLQQFDVDLEYQSNAKLIAGSNANLTRNALAELFWTRRTVNQAHTPRWYKEMKKLIPLIRAGMPP